MVLLCVALLVSGLMPQGLTAHRHDENAAQQVQEESVSRRKDLVFEQVSDTPGTAGESSASLSELLPLVSDAGTADPDTPEFLCAYIQ